MSETRRPLEVNTSRGGMKKIMEEMTSRHVKAIHYSVSVGIRVGEEKNTRMRKDARFSLVILEGFSGMKLGKKEADHAARQIQEGIG